MENKNHEEREDKRRRESVSYKLFEEWYDFAAGKPSAEEMVKKLYDFMDKKFMFGSVKMADSALLSMNLLLSDKGEQPQGKSFERNVFIVNTNPSAAGSIWPEGTSPEDALGYAHKLEHALAVKFRNIRTVRTDMDETSEYGPYPVQGPDAKEIWNWVVPRMDSIISQSPIELRHFFRVELVGSGSTSEEAWGSAIEGFIEDPGPVPGEDEYTTEYDDALYEHPDDYYYSSDEGMVKPAAGGMGL